ncbi:hypothetical protein IFM89_001550 [Coptis chinensis]|uniref:Raptor N-terminal CASPase-like domain-containing protein n=1 Tax=Coptis chinensis TaxID=261450 RepID=A0A835HAC3_9MAGN|nr:hypothetical protein IFM89_001550 [Coptis chinensis]
MRMGMECRRKEATVEVPSSSCTCSRVGTIVLSELRHDSTGLVSKWRPKDRIKNGCVALVLCLNISVDPPDVIKISPCARMECWIDLFSMAPPNALEQIGAALSLQYERWQPRAKYKLQLDPTVDEVKKLCLACRKHAKAERVLFHYNGHGVPKPTANGEIWLFNKCQDSSSPGSSGSSIKDSILLAACEAHETLPQSAEFPADVFTSCLTTPIKMPLRWFCARSLLLRDTLDHSLIDKIPGLQNDRKTLLGELNWIFTAVTDIIAWNVLPHGMHGSQLPSLLDEPNAEFQLSPFFTEQLTAFEEWLDHRYENKKPPEQLPIRSSGSYFMMLLVLYSQCHRFRGLVLLGRFLDMGPWAVDLVRASIVFAMGTLLDIGSDSFKDVEGDEDSDDDEKVRADLNIVKSLLTFVSDGSPLVRAELAVAFARFAFGHNKHLKFIAAAYWKPHSNSVLSSLPSLANINGPGGYNATGQYMQGGNSVPSQIGPVLRVGSDITSVGRDGRMATSRPLATPAKDPSPRIAGLGRRILSMICIEQVIAKTLLFGGSSVRQGDPTISSPSPNLAGLAQSSSWFDMNADRPDSGLADPLLDATSSGVSERSLLPQSTIYNWSCGHFSRPLLTAADDNEEILSKREQKEKLALDRIAKCQRSCGVL